MSLADQMMQGWRTDGKRNVRGVLIAATLILGAAPGARATWAHLKAPADFVRPGLSKALSDCRTCHAIEGEPKLNASLAKPHNLFGARLMAVGEQLPPPVHAGARRDFSALLMWHDVVPQKKEVWFDTSVAEIERQFADIRKQGLTPVTLERLADHLIRGAPIPAGAVVLTFDDNNLGLYRYLFPVLRRYRWPAALFVHTDYVGKPTGKPHCNWEQLREMERSGLVRAYPHTASHPPDMRRLADRQLEQELVRPRKKLESELGGARPFFCYSNGFYDERVARAALAAGYGLAITEDWGAAERSPNLMMIRRYSMHKRAQQAIRDVAQAMRKRKTAGPLSGRPDLGAGVGFEPTTSRL